MSEVYPVFLTGLHRRRCLVLGGGAEAERKVQGLLAARAAVTVISAEVTPALRAWAEAGTIAWIPRPYRPGDLQGAFLVIATAQDRETVAQLQQEAEAAGALLNVVDDPAHSTFLAGAVLRRGALTVAISTGGGAPALAVRLRQRLERLLGPEYGELLALLQRLRPLLAARYPDFAQRRALWYALLDATLPLLEQGRLEQMRQQLAALLDPELLAALDAEAAPAAASLQPD
ncbi:MAG: precorrin-2 dehydrogenase [Candidatus Tectimicrobiota bacterium]|nr:MAG: precorrin-2 dehydrogenase [Candidatus Tectomicrobia bacterium]